MARLKAGKVKILYLVMRDGATPIESIAEPYVPTIVAPAERVLQPVDVVVLGVVLARMGAAGLGAVRRPVMMTEA